MRRCREKRRRERRERKCKRGGGNEKVARRGDSYLDEVASEGGLFTVKRRLISNQSRPAFSQNLPIGLLNEPTNLQEGRRILP